MLKSIIKKFFTQKRIIEIVITDEDEKKDLFESINSENNIKLLKDVLTDVADTTEASELEEPTYPPVIDGLKIINPFELAKRQKDLIYQIRSQAGIGSDISSDYFDKYYLDPILKLAALVQELPASEYDHHRGLGGLFEHSLEVSLNALKISKGFFLPPIGTVEIEQERKRRWEYAAWLSALLHDIGKPMTMMKIISEKGNTWTSYTIPLYEWAKEEGSSRYVIVWNDNRKYEDHKRAAISWFYKIASKDVVDHLQSGGDRLMEEITFALTDYSHQQTYLSNIIRKSDSISVQMDFERRVDRILGKKRVSLATEFVNVIRALKKISWNELGYNNSKSMVWIIDGDVYLSWPDAIKIILRELQTRNISIPSDYITASQILESKRLIVPPSTGGVYVFKPKGVTEVVQLIRLAGPTLFLDGDVVPGSAEGVFTNYEMQKKQETIKRYIENAIEGGVDIDDISKDLNERIFRNEKQQEMDIKKSSTVSPKVFTSNLSASEILEAQNEVKETEESMQKDKDASKEKENAAIAESSPTETKVISGLNIKVQRDVQPKKEPNQEQVAPKGSTKPEQKKSGLNFNKPKVELENSSESSASEKENEQPNKEIHLVSKQEKREAVKEIKEKIANEDKNYQDQKQDVTQKVKQIKEGLVLDGVVGAVDEETKTMIMEKSKIVSKKDADEFLKSKKQAGAFIKEVAEMIRNGHFQKLHNESSPVFITDKIANTSLMLFDFDSVCIEVGRTSPHSALKTLKENGMIICQEQSMSVICFFDYIIKVAQRFQKVKRIILTPDTTESILYYSGLKKAEEDKGLSDNIETVERYANGIKISKNTLKFFDLIVEVIQKENKDWKIDYEKGVVWVDTKFVVGFINEFIQDEVLFKTELEAGIENPREGRIAGKQMVYLPSRWLKEVNNGKR